MHPLTCPYSPDCSCRSNLAPYPSSRRPFWGHAPCQGSICIQPGRPTLEETRPARDSSLPKSHYVHPCPPFLFGNQHPDEKHWVRVWTWTSYRVSMQLGQSGDSQAMFPRGLPAEAHHWSRNSWLLPAKAGAQAARAPSAAPHT